MSCWVVPTIAAEIWGMPLDHLMNRIGKGQVPTKLEQGFMFVDVAPDGPRYSPMALPPQERPQTYTMISSDELQLSTTDHWDEADNEADDEDAGIAEEHEEQDEELLPLEEPEPPVSRGDWRTARRETSRLRVPPPRMSVAAA